MSNEKTITNSDFKKRMKEIMSNFDAKHNKLLSAMRMLIHVADTKTQKTSCVFLYSGILFKCFGIHEEDTNKSATNAGQNLLQNMDKKYVPLIQEALDYIADGEPEVTDLTEKEKNIVALHTTMMLMSAQGDGDKIKNLFGMIQTGKLKVD